MLELKLVLRRNLRPKEEASAMRPKLTGRSEALASAFSAPSASRGTSENASHYHDCLYCPPFGCL